MVTVPFSDAFTVTPVAFRAVGGQSAHCHVTLRASAPAGWTYGVSSIATRGFAQIDTGATGVMRVGTWLTPGQGSITDTIIFTGPLASEWRTEGVAEVPLWASCGVSHLMTIDEILQATGPTTSVLEVDSMAAIIVHLVWRQC